MGANNQKSQPGYVDNNPQIQQNSKTQLKQKQGPVSSIVENKQQTIFGLPENIQNRQQVRECINKYNQKIDLQMKKPYVQQFFNMRQKLLKNMETICKSDYSLPQIKGKIQKPNRQLKQCMQSVQTLISEQDQRMQQQFGIKLFLLADKCLIKEQNTKQKNKDKKKGAIDVCVDKLVKYRNLNMEMHILKLELAREML